MSAESGELFLLKAGDGGTPTEVFTTVAALRTTDLSINAEIIDTTSKDSSGWRDQLRGGVRSVSVSGSGVFTDDASQRDIRTKALNASINNYQVVFENGDAFQGAFKITSLGFGGEHNGEATFDFTIESSGPVTIIPGA